jgi:hypothetical protein
VSHISTDRVLTGALVAVLRNPGFDALFIDFDPANGIPPGCNWENELYTALRGCEAVVGIDSASCAHRSGALQRLLWRGRWVSWRQFTREGCYDSDTLDGCDKP